MIERARIAGASLDDCADRFGVGRDAVARHMANHVPEGIKAQYIIDEPIDRLLEKAANEGRTLLDYLHILRSIVLQQLQIAATANSARGVASLSGRFLEILQETGRLTGELMRSAPSTTINNNTAIFMASPAFNSLQGMLLERLGPFPEARAAVIAGLMDLESQALPSGMGMPPVLEHAHAA